MQLTAALLTFLCQTQQKPEEPAGAKAELDTVAFVGLLDWPLVSIAGVEITGFRAIIALVVLIAGLYTAQVVARSIARRIIEKRGLDPSASYFLQLAGFSVFAGLTFVLTLSAANLPWSVLATLLDFKILTVDGVPLTIRKLIFALLVLALGLYVARRLAQTMSERLFRPMGLDVSFASALQSVCYYLFTVLAFLLFLDLLSIPLTTFAVFGGAIAIGVGFGSQNIVNNFISGLILLAERPVRVGDTVEVEGVTGEVKHVGARCTNVRTFSNIDVLVPNSYFLENRVVNWTLKDRIIRFEMPLGVAYGSPTREIERLLLQAVEEHQEVLRSPIPEALFMDFGDSALNFEVRFWVDTAKSNRMRVASDIRHRIDELFREAGICIPFPQRDVHVDSPRPLRIEITKPEPGEDSHQS